MIGDNLNGTTPARATNGTLPRWWLGLPVSGGISGVLRDVDHENGSVDTS